MRVGNAEAPECGRQAFGAVAKAGTDIVTLIRRALDTLGRTSDTELTAFTDGCSSLRAILAAAGIPSLPILDWFHLSVRLQHAKQVADALPVNKPDQVQANAGAGEPGTARPMMLGSPSSACARSCLPSNASPSAS